VGRARTRCEPGRAMNDGPDSSGGQLSDSGRGLTAILEGPATRNAAL